MSSGRGAPATGQDQPWSGREQRDARRAYSRLGRAGQFELLQEVVLARGAELRRAYPDLVGIGFGFRTRRKEAGAAPQLLRTPCVVFEVMRKPAFGRSVAASRELPRVLYAFTTIEGRRCLCALPADIRESREFGRAAPHKGSDQLPFGVAVYDDANGDPTGGALTCAVERGDGNLYVDLP